MADSKPAEPIKRAPSTPTKLNPGTSLTRHAADSAEQQQANPGRSNTTSWPANASRINLQFRAMDFLTLARNDPNLRAETRDGYIRAARNAGLSTDEIAAGLGLNTLEAAELGTQGET